MEGRLLLKDVSVLLSTGQVVAGMSVVVSGAGISALAPTDELPTLPGDWEISGRKRLVTMGRVIDAQDLLSAFETVRLLGDEADKKAFIWATALRSGVCGLENLEGPLADGARHLGLSIGSTAKGDGVLLNGPADVVVWDWVPSPGPFDLAAHLPFLQAAWVVVQGRVVVREGQLLTADFLSLAAKAAAREVVYL